MICLGDREGVEKTNAKHGLLPFWRQASCVSKHTRNLFISAVQVSDKFSKINLCCLLCHTLTGYQKKKKIININELYKNITEASDMAFIFVYTDCLMLLLNFD